MTTPSLRRHDLDWLRVLAMLNIFFFHCARYFNDEDWHVKNPQLWLPADVLIMVVVIYIMPLFFILSAHGSYYSLQRRSAGEYAGERFYRLFVPLLFGALVVIAPVQVWIERATHEPFYAQSFVYFMRHDYFQGWYLFGGNFAWMGMHLWYLLVLFLYSLLTLPLFTRLPRPGGAKWVAGLADRAERRGGVFWLVAPIYAAELLVNLQPDGVGMTAAGGWSLVTYLVYFVVGYVVAMDPRFGRAMERDRRGLLSAGLFLTAVSLLGHYKLTPNIEGVPGYLLGLLIRAAAAWCLLTAILGYGSRYLNYRNRFLDYAGEAVLPFYILHQTVIVVLGYFGQNWALTPGLKYPLLCLASFVVIMALFEGPVRRTGVLRFLFGMKKVR